jgi:hypothetical protein
MLFSRLFKFNSPIMTFPPQKCSQFRRLSTAGTGWHPAKSTIAGSGNDAEAPGNVVTGNPPLTEDFSISSNKPPARVS